ncbi:MAG TPA: 5'/3'-nucleotidase SurE, partial [Pyrinomonadaceae bacterium]|nr:5'/3'-nucleotidase SurE [Pyrinomonadaceae bacterium]
MARPRILLTNDDGYYADGIKALEASLKEIGDVYLVAPESEMSGASHSLTLARPLRIRQRSERHWTVDGTPTDCVTLALNQILGDDERPLELAGVRGVDAEIGRQLHRAADTLRDEAERSVAE